MRENIREEIMEEAKLLFDKNGYNGVSIKNISDSLGISTGNLTYYFKRKEDLAEALIVKQHQDYKHIEAPGDVIELYAYFLKVITIQISNSYYYNHYVQFSQISPKIKEIQGEVYSDLKKLLITAFHNLYENSMFMKDVNDNQCKLIIDTILIILISSVYTDKEINRIECIWNTVLPILTENGLNEYSAIIKKKENK